ncbi:MAG: TetR/AcrR family transcriptional regulator [Bacteroidales bacterium]
MEPRERIIQTAIRLFRQNGIRPVTMDWIATEAGVSKRTIYELFSDKSDLLNVCISEINRRNVEELHKIRKNSCNIIETIRNLGEFHIQTLQTYHPRFFLDIQKFFPREWTQMNQEREKQSTSEILALLKEGIKEGLIRADLHLQVVGRIIYELFRLAFTLETGATDYSDRRTIFNNLIINYFRGIVTNKGLEALEETKKENLSTENPHLASLNPKI